jgi:hypothetical protein
MSFSEGAKTMKPARRRARRVPSKRSLGAPVLASTQAGAVVLATVLAEEAGGWRVRIGAQEQVMVLDPSVDPALVREALEEGARALVEANPVPTLVGVVQTSRALRVDRQGGVDAEVERFQVHASQGAMLKTAAAFLQVKGAEVELYGERILSRAREVAKILARMINLN